MGPMVGMGWECLATDEGRPTWATLCVAEARLGLPLGPPAEAEEIRIFLMSNLYAFCVIPVKLASSLASNMSPPHTHSESGM